MVRNSPGANQLPVIVYITISHDTILGRCLGWAVTISYIAIAYQEKLVKIDVNRIKLVPLSAFYVFRNVLGIFYDLWCWKLDWLSFNPLCLSS